MSVRNPECCLLGNVKHAALGHVTASSLALAGRSCVVTVAVPGKAVAVEGKTWALAVAGKMMTVAVPGVAAAVMIGLGAGQRGPSSGMGLGAKQGGQTVDWVQSAVAGLNWSVSQMGLQRGELLAVERNTESWHEGGGIAACNYGRACYNHQLQV